MVKTADDVVISATNFVSERLCPIFQVCEQTFQQIHKQNANYEKYIMWCDILSVLAIPVLVSPILYFWEMSGVEPWELP